MTTSPPALEILKQAASGLLFPSETDAPFEPFFQPAETTSDLTPERLAQLANIPADRPIKTVKLNTFFRPATKNEEWHNEEEKEQVEKFKSLVKVIKDNLDDVKVFRVGDTATDVYVVGKVEGGYAGLKTKVVET